MAEEIAALAQCLPIPNTGEEISPADCIRLAASEARKGIGFVSPNPAVGCVIVDRDHKFVSSGYHHRYGFAHAEIDALEKVRKLSLLEGATVYVTLEPCAHEGKTGSCAKALAKLPIKRVVYGVEDPFPLVAGKGAQILKDARIETFALKEAFAAGVFGAKVTDARLAEELEQLCEETAETFLHSTRTSHPFVAIKVASTLDGRMAHSSGESKWITEEKARRYSHYLRAHYDAVMIGRNTFVADDPSLNVRLPGFDEERNHVVLIDPAGKTLYDLANSKIVSVRPPEKVIVVLSERALAPDDYLQKKKLAEMGIRFVEVPFEQKAEELEDLAATARQLLNPPLDTRQMLRQLYKVGLRSVFVEGGAQTFANLLNAKAVQRLHLFIAPSLLGGRNGLSWSEDFASATFAHRARLTQTRWREITPDLYFTGKFVN